MIEKVKIKSKNLSIKSRLALILTTLFLILSCIIVYVTYLYSVEYSLKTRLEIRSAVDNGSEKIENDVLLLQQSGNILSKVGETYYSNRISGLFDDDLDSLNETTIEGMINVAKTIDHASAFGIVFDEEVFGELHNFHLTIDGPITTLQEDLSYGNFDYTSRDWYIDSVKYLKSSNDDFWTEPYITAGGSDNVTITFTKRIFYGEVPLGVAYIDWTVEELLQFIYQEESLRPTDSSFITCVDVINGIHIGKADKNEIIIDVKKIGDIDYLKDYNFNEEEGIYKFDIDNDTSRYITYHKELSNGILIISSVKESEAFADMLYDILGVSLILIFIGVATIVLLYLVIKAFVKPFNVLKKGANELGSGKFDFEIKIDGNNEFNELATSYNNMAKNIRLYTEKLKEETQKISVISSELAVAEKIQFGLLPRNFDMFDDIDEIDIRAFNTPAKEIGGDFYDYFMLDEKRLAFIIADVSGKGIAAALYMVIAKMTVREQALMKLSPGEVLTNVNNKLCQDNETNMFVTAFYAELNLETGVLRYSNAGHNPYVVISKKESPKYHPLIPGLVLGGFEGYQYKSHETTLNYGDSLFLYTDGITEAFNNDNVAYGEDRLLEVLNNVMDPTEIIDKIYSDVFMFVDGAEQSDDITMLALSFKGGKNE